MTDYVIMVSRGLTLHDEVIGNSEYWWDLTCLYEKIKATLPTDTEFYLHYGKGSSYVCQNTSYRNHTANITGKCTNTDIKKSITLINNKINTGDNLIVWWLGHGDPHCGGDSVDPISAVISPNHLYENMILQNSPLNICQRSHDDFWRLVDIVDINKLATRLLLISTCYSGRLSNFKRVTTKYNHQKTTLLTSCNKSQMGGSYDDTPDGLFHSELDWHLIQSFDINPVTLKTQLKHSMSQLPMSSTHQFYYF